MSTSSYAERCQLATDAMLADCRPRLHSPVERGEYATAYRNELLWRLVWGADKGSAPPDLMGTAYEASYVDALKRAGKWGRKDD